MCCQRLVQIQMPVSNSSDLKVDLVIVQLETFLLSRYQLPDVPRRIIENLLKNIHGRKIGEVTLTLCNMQGAALVVPSRLISKILVNGEVRWASLV